MAMVFYCLSVFSLLAAIFASFTDADWHFLAFLALFNLVGAIFHSRAND